MTTIKLRRGTAAEWATANPVLALGEPGYETNTGLHKIGDGATVWAQLDYFLPASRITAGSPVYSRPAVRNRVKLARWGTALRDKTAPVITVIGNSISHGVGSDGFTATTPNYHEPYREYSWVAQLRKGIARQGGYLPAENFVHPGSWFGVTQNLVGGAVRSTSVSAFGPLSGGGLVLNSATAAADFLAARMGKFTHCEVLYWGGLSGTGGYSPRVLIDDVEVHAGGFHNPGGNLVRVTVSGLSDAQHKITVQGTGPVGCAVAGVVTRRGATGVVVNRVAFPGSTAAHVEGDGAFTTAQKNRNRDAAVMAGYSDLVILCMTANEVYNQHPLVAYQAAVQAIIDRATSQGACVLLMGDPAVNDEETAYAIKGSDYRAVLAGLSDSNAHVAYADFNALFGTREDAVAKGLFAAGGSVHPLHEGHRRMADFLFRDVLPGASVL